jgi:hypothetical protein
MPNAHRLMHAKGTEHASTPGKSPMTTSRAIEIFVLCLGREGPGLGCKVCFESSPWLGSFHDFPHRPVGESVNRRTVVPTRRCYAGAHDCATATSESPSLTFVLSEKINSLMISWIPHDCPGADGGRCMVSTELGLHWFTLT